MVFRDWVCYNAITLKVSTTKYKICYYFMGSTLIFSFVHKCFKLPSFSHWLFNVFLNRKMGKTFINVYYTMICSVEYCPLYKMIVCSYADRVKLDAKHQCQCWAVLRRVYHHWCSFSAHGQWCRHARNKFSQWSQKLSNHILDNHRENLFRFARLHCLYTCMSLYLHIWQILLMTVFWIVLFCLPTG